MESLKQKQFKQKISDYEPSYFGKGLYYARGRRKKIAGVLKAELANLKDGEVIKFDFTGVKFLLRFFQH